MRPRIKGIEYMRGIGMVGVVGIHVGSQYLGYNPTPNLQLLAAYEIFTRFAVPVFFFISAFGLFYNLDLTQKFSFGKFLKRRIKTVGIPYVVWSLVYLLEYSLVYHQWGSFLPGNLLHILLWGLACYQLYFMVILLWFYLFFPLWLWIVPRLNRNRLILLFFLQMAFNYYSSYCINIYEFQESVFRPLVEFRLNYLILHYVFIFLLGGYVAVHYPLWRSRLAEHLNYLRWGAAGSLALLLSHYYYCIYRLGYNGEGAINTAHQLSPAGLVYTLAMCLYLLAECQDGILSKVGTTLQHLFGKHSYFIYLAHPMIITLLKMVYVKYNLVMNAVNSIAFFFLVVFLTLGIGMLLRRLSEVYCPWFNALTIGVYKK